MNSTRPVNLDLLRMRFPVTAVVSILHRLSGIIMFIFLPLFLYIISQASNTPSSYHQLQTLLLTPWMIVLIWGILSASIYHILAGVRHLLADMGVGESLAFARCSAWLLIIVEFVVIAILGVWLW